MFRYLRVTVLEAAYLATGQARRAEAIRQAMAFSSRRLSNGSGSYGWN